MSEFEYDEFLGDPVPSTETPSKVGASAVEDTSAAPEPAAAAPVAAEVPETAEPVAETAAATPPTTPTALDPDIAALLARERLPAVANETDSAALRRLYDHQRQRADRLYYEEVKGTKAEARAAREELAEFKRAMSPLITAFSERQAEAQRELEAAKIPEPGTPEFLAWQQQQILNKLNERDELDAEARQRAEEADRIESVVLVDEAADAELDNALATDPEAKAAYEFAVQLGMRAVARAYPNASPDQLREVVALSHTLDMRNARANGIRVADLFKQRKADVIGLLGIAGASTNGHAAAAPAPVTPANGKAGSPTARQLAAAKAQAPARAVVSPTQTAIAAPTGDGVDFGSMDEDALLDYVLADPSNASEYSRWIQEKHGRATWR